MVEHSSSWGRRAAARRAVSFWYRMGLARADANPPQAFAHAYALGRRMATLRPRLGRLGPTAPPGRGQRRTHMAADSPCARCGGTGEVSGVVDDIEFTFQCPCSGGDAESVRWLLGAEEEASAIEDWNI